MASSMAINIEAFLLIINGLYVVQLKKTKPPYFKRKKMLCMQPEALYLLVFLAWHIISSRNFQRDDQIEDLDGGAPSFG